jgi:crotonobetainyl-CoA:carnitine CoA-transferase CaiB-like acyl-CoA transferase
LVAELDAVFAGRPTEEWVEVLLAAGVPAGKIRGVGEALRNAGVAVATVQHPTAGALDLVAAPFSLARAAVRPPAPPPLLGQHTAEVLAEVGVTEDRQAELEQRGVIARAAAT